MSLLPKALADLGVTFDRAVGEISQTVRALQQAARADDKTPLLNGLALNSDGGEFGGVDGLSVIVFGDLNRFKSINDTHGHAAGDAAISQVGNMVNTLLVIGCQGKGYRRSGDEFVILLKKDSLDNFRKSAASFGHCPFHINGKALSVSMSFGFAVTDDIADWFELMKRAELACLAAKKLGDGQVVEWTPGVADTAVINRRFRCGCGTQFSCDIPVGQVPAAFVCPCCGQPQSANVESPPLVAA